MICRQCGQSVPDDSRFCPYCQTPLFAAEAIPPAKTETKKSGKSRVWIVLFVLTVIFLIGCLRTIGRLSDEISELEEEIRARDEIVAAQEEIVNNYEAIVDAAKSDMLQSKSSHFNVDRYVVFVNRGSSTDIRLTAFWPGGGTVSVSNSSPQTAGYDYKSHSWNTSVEIAITGREKGVSVLTFSNTIDDMKLKVLIIVE